MSGKVSSLEGSGWRLEVEVTEVKVKVALDVRESMGVTGTYQSHQHVMVMLVQDR